MKIVAALLITVLWATAAGAADIVAVFGASMVPCTLAVTKTTIKANNTDSTIATLVDGQGHPITTAVDVVNAHNNKMTKAVSFPPGGFTLTASAPGDWVFTISSPVYDCNSVEVTAIP